MQLVGECSPGCRSFSSGSGPVSRAFEEKRMSGVTKARKSWLPGSQAQPAWIPATLGVSGTFGRNSRATPAGGCHESFT